MNQTKQFSLNGEIYVINHEITLLDLIKYFDYNDSLLVLEYNNTICNKKKWKTIVIENNDTIEIVTIVGGG